MDLLNDSIFINLFISINQSLNLVDIISIFIYYLVNFYIYFWLFGSGCY